MSKLYKVIKLLSDNSLIVDYGKNDGAYEGDDLRIFTPGEEVVFQGTNYGTLDLIKADIEVISVFPKFSVCQKINRKIVKSFNLSNYLTREIEEVQKLNMNKEEISNTFYKDTSPIKLGDLVKILK
jgi:hypothetical protein